MEPMDLRALRHWIFDLDGTLTLAVHDFDALRRDLGLPLGQPILEAVAERPPDEAQRLMRELDLLEARLVEETSAAPGASELLGELASRSCRLGILTRNSRENALATLEHCGLSAHFDAADVLGRDEVQPKPHPAGILTLLGSWSADTSAAVMLGDFRYDLEAGRAAGVMTVSVDPSGAHPFASLADHCVDSLAELVIGPP